MSDRRPRSQNQKATWASTPHNSCFDKFFHVLHPDDREETQKGGAPSGKNAHTWPERMMRFVGFVPLGISQQRTELHCDVESSTTIGWTSLNSEWPSGNNIEMWTTWSSVATFTYSVTVTRHRNISDHSHAKPYRQTGTQTDRRFAVPCFQVEGAGVYGLWQDGEYFGIPKKISASRTCEV